MTTEGMDPGNDPVVEAGAAHVVVVGGGLAGLSAACRLATEGRRVTLFEGRARLGGATFSFERDNLTVDNGQHVLLRCYEEYRAFLDLLGVGEHVADALYPRVLVDHLNQIVVEIGALHLQGAGDLRPEICTNAEKLPGHAVRHRAARPGEHVHQHFAGTDLRDGDFFDADVVYGAVDSGFLCCGCGFHVSYQFIFCGFLEHRRQ